MVQIETNHEHMTLLNSDKLNISPILYSSFIRHVFPRSQKSDFLDIGMIPKCNFKHWFLNLLIYLDMIINREKNMKQMHC